VNLTKRHKTTGSEKFNLIFSTVEKKIKLSCLLLKRIKMARPTELVQKETQRCLLIKFHFAPFREQVVVFP